MIVLDCSVILDLVVRPSTIEAPDPGLAWQAPALLDVEFVSGLRGLLLAGHLEEEAARLALEDYADLAITTWPTAAAQQRRVLELRHNLTAYDAAYVALAEALDAPLVTRDRRLAAAAPAGIRIEVV